MAERLNYWIDILLLVCFIIVGVSGLVLHFAFVSGVPGGGKAVTFLGTTKAAWQPWHTYSGIAMILLIVVHLILHLKWLWRMTKNLFVRREGVFEQK